jgi:hypothetical protein
MRGVPQPNGSRMAERERRIRLAYFEGAEFMVAGRDRRALTEGELEAWCGYSNADTAALPTVGEATGQDRRLRPSSRARPRRTDRRGHPRLWDQAIQISDASL